jgi:serine/threonine-protein kinase
MEYIDGTDLYSYVEQYPENINNIFEQIIKGFIYLEDNNILHRDIRPLNIIVDNNHNVKIIDFGFGKKIDFVEDNNKSISINWWGGETPDEFKEKVYDTKTEIFFIGKLFEELLSTLTVSFKYKAILKNMIDTNYKNRINSFREIQKKLNSSMQNENPFNTEERMIYQDFSNRLFSALIEREFETNISMDNEQIIQQFELLQKRIMLEDYINPKHILRIFLNGDFRCSDNYSFSTDSLIEFFDFFKSLSKEKQNMVLYGLEINFDDIEVYYDEIPF